AQGHQPPAQAQHLLTVPVSAQGLPVSFDLEAKDRSIPSLSPAPAVLKDIEDTGDGSMLRPRDHIILKY
ncbi:MAG TPA: hypothetical protein P5550_12310, partial [Bacteroidales bacterium]|nr:hypothetical protein [Bacteroidales bacterium]